MTLENSLLLHVGWSGRGKAEKSLEFNWCCYFRMHISCFTMIFSHRIMDIVVLYVPVYQNYSDNAFTCTFSWLCHFSSTRKREKYLSPFSWMENLWYFIQVCLMAYNFHFLACCILDSLHAHKFILTGWEFHGINFPF